MDAKVGDASGARKFDDPFITAKGERRAVVQLRRLETLWFNTGTLCNIECANCYIESSPTNDRLAYLTAAEVTAVLDEAERIGQRPRLVAFTGGEPFMNPALFDMLDTVLRRGHEALILTNAMRPMMRPRIQAALKGVHARFGDKLSLRVSIDHWRPDLHDEERGAKSFDIAWRGLKWLVANGFRISVAGRRRWDDEENDMRQGFAALFARHAIPVDAQSPEELVIFPEMDVNVPVPEISEGCWAILNKRPDDMMCASSRMVVKRAGADAPSIVACTLLPYDARFDTGPRLADALAPVPLNHPHCAKFCVLGGGSCTA
jgi:uncharacterized Fe-S cluster-containing radical SAM superfamily protein